MGAQIALFRVAGRRERPVSGTLLAADTNGGMTMRTWSRVIVGALVAAAFVVATAGAQMQAQSGDTCTATGAGAAYTLQITVPSGPQEYGFAFGAPGATVTNAVVSGTNGSFTTLNLPPGTTGAWISDTPLTGVPDASLTVSGTATGSLTIVPAGSATQPTYFSPVTCTFAKAAQASNAFTVARQVAYVRAARVWHLTVTIPGAGTVSAQQLEPTIGTGSAKTVTAKSLVQSRKLTLKSAGKVTLTLRPTATGQVDLRKSGSIRVKLNVTFDPKSGKAASKLLDLRLER